MTREEAKEILQGARITSFRPNGTARVKEALDLAIEALSADVVSRDVYEKRTQADEEIIDSYRQEFQKAVSAEAEEEEVVIRKILEKGMIELPQEYVSAVRCKDCRHYESDGGAFMVCSITDMVTDDDDFCSYGERREE